MSFWYGGHHIISFSLVCNSETCKNIIQLWYQHFPFANCLYFKKRHSSNRSSAKSICHLATILCKYRKIYLFSLHLSFATPDRIIGVVFYGVVL